jgi:hypothetical protein
MQTSQRFSPAAHAGAAAIRRQHSLVEYRNAISSRVEIAHARQVLDRAVEPHSLPDVDYAVAGFDRRNVG